MNTIIKLLVILLLISGCGSQKRVVANIKETPSWYMTPPKPTSSTLYAVGEGENRDAAVADALSAMLASLSVSISSNFRTKSVVKEGAEESFNTTSVNEIESVVQKIRISSYEVVEFQEMGFKKYIVLVQSDKRKLFESLKKELDQKFEIIESKRLKSQSYNTIKQLAISKEAKASVSDVLSTLLVMNVLDSSFDDSMYIAKTKAVDEHYEQLHSSITFSVHCNDEAQNLVAPIKSGLSAQKLTLQDASGEKHFNIYIQATIEKAESYGFSLARSAIVLVVKDSYGAIIGSNKLNITGQSTQGYAIAKESVAVKLNEMIKRDGIGKILGLEL